MSSGTGEFGICYFNHGTKHLARLVVSLRSLEMWRLERETRERLNGAPKGSPVNVAILHTEPKWNPLANDVIQRIPRSFPGLSIRLVEIPLAERQRHSCYVTKSTLWRYSPFDATVLLDADTMVVGEFRELFDWAEEPKHSGIVVTRFSNWHTQGKIVGGRVRQWREKNVRCAACGTSGAAGKELGVDAASIAGMVAKAVEYPWPALNTGVVAWRKGAPILERWEMLTRAGWRCSFTDELAMQLLITKFPHVLVGDEFNWSPIYGRAERENVRIAHFHGNKQLRDGVARELWLPVYEECVKENVAGIREWTPGGDKRLGVFLGKA